MSEPSVMTHPLTGQACCLVPMEEYKSITDKLHAYEKQWTDMDYTIGHLRQENAQLKAELLCKETEWAKIFESLKSDLSEANHWRGRHCRDAEAYGKQAQKNWEEIQRCKTALEKCLMILSKARHVSWNYYQGASHIEISPNEEELRDALESIKSSATTHNPQPTQDPATAIAYGLYPGSARPVNPWK